MSTPLAFYHDAFNLKEMAERFTDNITLRRYELLVNGQIAFADYQHKEKGVLTILYVEAPPELRGTGAAGRLMQQVMQDAKTKNLKVRPICSYAAAWIQRSPDHRAMLAD